MRADRYSYDQMNMFGAKDRPILKEVWENVEAHLRGHERVLKKVAKTTVTGVMCKKIFG